MFEQIEKDIELDDVLIDDIIYDDKSLLEWNESFTIRIPNLPCTSLEINQCLSTISSAYQDAYNAYINLQVMANKAENEFKSEKYRLVNLYMDSLRAAKISKLPSKENAEIYVCNNDNNKKLKLMLDRFQAYEVIKDYFYDHKQKLERLIDIAKNISFSCNASEKAYNGGKIGQGL